ncbi:MAG TPA: DUF861 domain-containing protein [Candidatus Moranbacteria bacterium]|nr:DUF861 domain-containing protein [Candidatus Moranbacteria bacterium]
MKIEVRKPTQEEVELAQGWETWTKEVSEFPWSYDQQETCLILKGKVEVTTQDGQKVSFEAGDWVVFPVGLKCVWRIIEPVEKRYQFS